MSQAIQKQGRRMITLNRKLKAVGTQGDRASSLRISVWITLTKGEGARSDLTKQLDVVVALADGRISENVEDHRDGQQCGQDLGPLTQRVDRPVWCA